MALKSNLVPVAMALFPLIFIILIIIAGVSPSILSNFYFLQLDVTTLSIPSALSTSPFLTALTSLAGLDLTGETSTPQTLSLANTYTVHLLTACATTGSETTCSSPRFAFHFDPSTDLKLSQTALNSPDLAKYAMAATFLSILYLLSAVLTFLSSVFALLRGSRFPRAPRLAAVFSALSVVILFMAAIASLVAYTLVKKLFYESFSKFGINSSLGHRLFGLAWFTALLDLATSISLGVLSRRPLVQDSKYVRMGCSDGKKSTGPAVLVTGSDGVVTGPFKKVVRASFLSRLPFVGGKGKYKQIEKGKGGKKKNKGLAGAVDEQDADWDPLVRRSREEEEHEGLGSGRGDSGRVIQMDVLPGSGKRSSRDVETAYEPFRREEERPPRTGKVRPYDPVENPL